MSPSSAQVRSRTLGALLALHAGDSLGATFEFESHASIRGRHSSGKAILEQGIVGGGVFRWPAGHATDDTDLTRAVLMAYVDRHRHRLRSQQEGQTELRNETGKDEGRFLGIPSLAARHMLSWLHGPPDWPDTSRTPGAMPRDVGGATLTGLTRLEILVRGSSRASGSSKWTYDPARDGFTGAGQGQAGNGSLMRCLPTGLFETDRDALVRDAMDVSKVTHDDVRCTVSCAAYCAIVRALVDRDDGNDDGATAAAPHTVPRAPSDVTLHVRDESVIMDQASQGGSDARGSANTSSLAAAVEATVELGLQTARRLESDSLGGRPGPGPVEGAILLGKRLSIAELAEHGPLPYLPGQASGYVLESLSLAVAAVLDFRPLAEVLVDVVRVGKDTDTNGAIAGGLLGARDGIDSLPSHWRETPLQFADEFERLVDELLSPH